MDLQQQASLTSRLVEWDSGEPSCCLLTPSSSRLFPCSPSSFLLFSYLLISSPSTLFLSSALSWSEEMIQRSIHSLSDCSFSPLCPAVLPHCHSGSNERSDGHGWYSRCHCASCRPRLCLFLLSEQMTKQQSTEGLHM